LSYRCTRGVIIASSINLRKAENIPFSSMLSHNIEVS